MASFNILLRRQKPDDSGWIFTSLLSACSNHKNSPRGLDLGGCWGADLGGTKCRLRHGPALLPLMPTFYLTVSGIEVDLMQM